MHYDQTEAASMNVEWKERDRDQSNLRAAQTRLDNAIDKAHEVTTRFLDRIDSVLQPEISIKDPGNPTSALVQGPLSSAVARIEDQANSVNNLVRRLSEAMDRLDT